MLATRAADASCSLVYVNLVGGQDELVFDGASLVFDPDGNVLAAAAPVRGERDARRSRRPLGVPQASSRSPGPPHRAAVAGDPDRGRAPPGHRRSPRWADRRRGRSAPIEEIYRALVLGTHDYVTKNGFSDVVIGLSGGIDSSLVAAVAADALGAGACPRRLHALPLLERSLPQRRPDPGRAAGNRFPHHRRSSRPIPPCSTCWPRPSPGCRRT